MHLIIADHTLKDYQGHSFEYCRSVRESAVSRGWKVTTLGTSQITHQIQSDLNASAFFKHDFFQHYPLSPLFNLLPSKLSKALESRWSYHQHSKSLYQDLCRLLPDCNTPDPVLVLFPTFSFNDIIGITQFAEKLSPQSNTQIAMVQHFTSRPNLEKDKFPHRLYKHSLNYLSQSPAKNRINLFTDSKELGEEYKYYINKPFKVLPIPHIQSPMKNETKTVQTKKLNVGYLGDARINKGFHLIPEAIKQVIDIIDDDECNWVIQSNIRNHQEWQIIQAVNLLKKMPNTHLHHYPMDTAAYHKLMSDIDIFILPYTLENYHSQTSGVFTEIRGIGKVSVVTRGTWMAREIRDHGGGILCAPEDSKSLADAIITCIKTYPKLKSEADSARDKWCDFHNCQRYLSELISDIVFRNPEKMGL